MAHPGSGGLERGDEGARLLVLIDNGGKAPRVGMAVIGTSAYSSIGVDLDVLAGVAGGQPDVRRDLLAMYALRAACRLGSLAPVLASREERAKVNEWLRDCGHERTSGYG